MDNKKYLEGLDIRIQHLSSKIGTTDLAELENLLAELKVLIHLKTTVQNEMHPTDEI